MRAERIALARDPERCKVLSQLARILCLASMAWLLIAIPSGAALSQATSDPSRTELMRQAEALA